ncbi:MAG TPA: bacterial transcriptional activator domain-containing protein [Terriglobales bacterium]|nr:bacterial transcriptional activator domain-containing protein [Terriglobales bacterium]
MSSPASATVPAPRLASALAAAICLLVPLMALVFHPALYAPFSAPKNALLIFAGTSLFALAAAGGVLKRPPRAAAWPAAALMVVIVLAWAASPFPHFGGRVVWLRLAGPMLAWVAISALAGRERLMLLAIAFAGAAESPIAIAQWFLGLDFFHGSTLLYQRMHLYGTFGNPDFVAVFIAATVPAALTLARDFASTSRAWTTFWWVMLAMELVAIIGTGCRTGLAAALAGAAVTLLMRNLRRPPRHWLRPRLVLWMALLAAASTFLVLSRNEHDFGLAGKARVFVWRVALSDDARRRPLGTGPGTLAYVYGRRVSPYYIALNDPTQRRFVTYERTANNDFVQAIVETGWPGLFTLLALLAVWGRFVTGVARAPNDDFQPAAIAAAAAGGVAAICVAALAEGPMQRAEIWMLLWLWLALPVAGFEPSKIRGFEEAQRFSQPRNLETSKPIFFLGWTAALAAIALSGWFGARQIEASYLAQRGEQREFANRYADAVADYRRSVALDPTNGTPWFNLTRTLAKSGDLSAALATSYQTSRWMDEDTVIILRVAILRAQHNYPLALREAAEGFARRPWEGQLYADVVEITRELGLAP